MRRRDFLGLIGSAVAARPLKARAQQSGPIRRVGVLMSYADRDPEGQARFTAFREGLRNRGWIERRNLNLEVRWATGSAELIQRYAKELVLLQPDLILSATTPTTTALLHETRVIPIVFANVSDPVGSGFVVSLSQPRGNVTGFINLEASIAGKWLDLLKEVAPRVSKVAFIFNPTTAPYAKYYLDPFSTAARYLDVEAIAAPVSNLSELEAAIRTLGSAKKGGMIVMPDSFTTAFCSEIVSLASRHGVPAIYPYGFFAEQGGLLSYGNDQLDNFRRAAAYADRILKGAKPTELPVQIPERFELVINLKVAKAIGVTVPPVLVARADKVIE